jgi:hypothetical protein
MRLLLETPDPPALIDPFTDSDVMVTYIENLIIQAEKQLPGTDRGPEKMEAVVDVIIRTVDLPVRGDREIGRLLAQAIYSSLARDLPAKLRSEAHRPPPTDEAEEE